MGVPGIYIHSLLGSRSWTEGVRLTGRLRSINRERLRMREVEEELATPESRRSQVFQSYRHLLSIRISEKAFHPNGPQQVMPLHPALFTLLRTSPDRNEQIVAIHNVANQLVTLDLSAVPLRSPFYEDLVSRRRINAGQNLHVEPYQVLWLKAGRES
jgi:sucrose phosphorylase